MRKPIESLTLAGFGDVEGDQAAAAGIAEGERLTEILRTPKADISNKAGRVERDSPLFFGTGDNPLLF